MAKKPEGRMGENNSKQTQAAPSTLTPSRSDLCAGRIMEAANQRRNGVPRKGVVVAAVADAVAGGVTVAACAVL